MTKNTSLTDTNDIDFEDHPEWTDDELANVVSFKAAFPDLAKSLESGIAVVSASKTTTVSVDLSEDILLYYQAQGDDWKSRLNTDLRKLAGLID